MNIEMLKKSGRIIFEFIAGSYCYNLYIEGKSDQDIRGIFINPKSEYLGLLDPSEQIGDEKHDTVYYSLKRFFDLAKNANPSVLEYLFVPPECIKINSGLYERLVVNRSLFISKKSYNSFSGYAYSQISRATGQNKMINHPELYTKPIKENYCWFIPKNLNNPPMRPIPLKETGIDLTKFHVSSLERVSNVFRLYLYGNSAKGVFRGDDMIVCESIPLEDEFNKYYGLLIYNKNEYEKTIIEHRKYKEWIENRNESRWIDQEKGIVKFDCKNMCHCYRLLLSGENILRHGFPLVRFEGEEREFLMKIRRGEFEYEEIMKQVEEKMENLKKLYETSTIPDSVDINKLDKLYRELTAHE
jgi:hypothetical protein